MTNIYSSRPTRTVVVRQDLHLRIGEEALRWERRNGQRVSRQQILERVLEQFFDLPEADRDQALRTLLCDPARPVELGAEESRGYPPHGGGRPPPPAY
jgi:hypothetical protein